MTIRGVDFYKYDPVFLADLRRQFFFWFVGFYLGPAPSDPNDSWMPPDNPTGPRMALEKLGLAPLPFYKGHQQSRSDGAVIPSKGAYEVGKSDAVMDLTFHGAFLAPASAHGLAKLAQFPAKTILFLDIEEWAEPLADTTIEYIKGWTDALVEEGTYVPGIYCSAAFASDLKIRVPKIARYWLFQNDGKDTGCSVDSADKVISALPLADVWQFAIECTTLKIAGASYIPKVAVDLNVSRSTNPANDSLVRFPIGPILREALRLMFS